MKRLSTTRTPPIRLALNVGGPIDLATGVFVKGKYNEDILLGGISNLQGLMGDPNTMKTAIALWMMGSAMNTIAYSYISEILLYDSEGTLRHSRITSILERCEHLDRDDEGNIIMDFQNISEIAPELWYDETFAKYIKAKMATKDMDVEIEFLKDPNTLKTLIMKLPTGMMIDTITYFNPSTSMDLVMGEIKGKGGSNDKSNNTLALQEGKYKVNMMATLTPALMRTNTYGMIVAHVGDVIDLNAGTYAPKARQQIGTLASNEKIKGVPNNYTRLLTGLWQTTNSKPLVHQDTKLAEFPKGNKLDSIKEELLLITLKQHKSKDNESRALEQLIVSQVEGVLPHLSQFYAMKNNKQYGMVGNVQNYAMVLYPDVKLSRTKVRGLIDSDSKLRRAIELTADLMILPKYHPQYEFMGLICTPEELYKDIDDMGYCWDKILTLTRNWWTPKQYSSPLAYLHILNLLKIRKGLYEYKAVLKLISKDK